MKHKLFLLAFLALCAQHLYGQTEQLNYRHSTKVEYPATTKLDNAALYDFIEWQGYTLQETEEGYVFFDNNGMGCFAKVIENREPCNSLYLKVYWTAMNKDPQKMRQVVQESMRSFTSLDAEVTDREDRCVVMVAMEPFVPSLEYLRAAFDEYIDNIEGYIDFLNDSYNSLEADAEQ